MMKKSIKDGIKIYQESPLTDRKKRIVDNSNKIIRGINLFISMIDNDELSSGWSSGSGNVVCKGAGLKILTDKQMLNHLPILLAQIQAGNNSIKLKNEIRQILYSLYRSKVLTKTVYNNLIKSIR